MEIEVKKLLIASILTTFMASSPAWANTSTDEMVSAKQVESNKEYLKVASQGFDAMRDIRMARGAIFEGQPKLAEDYLKEATKLLSEESTDWKSYVKKYESGKASDYKYVVINASIGLSEDYISSPEKKNAIKEANSKLSHGDKKGAIETLKLAGVTVMQSQYLMPLEATRKSVNIASKLLEEDKYYEANLVLKGAEDGVVVTSEGLIEGS